jgi:cell division septation protein DedD
MTFKNDVRNKTGAILTKSQEIFEKIFAQATREFSIRRKPKPAAKESAPAPTSGTPRPKEEKAKLTKEPEKIVSPQKTPSKAERARTAKPKPRPKTRGGSRVLRTSLLIVLLLVLGGFAANYFAIIDFSVVPDLFGLGPKQVVQAPVPKRQTPKPPSKPAIPQKPAQSEEKPPTAPAAPSAPIPPAVSKEEKLVELETPTTTGQSPPVKERIEQKAPPVAPQAQPSPPQSAAKEELQQVPVQAQVSEKPSAPKAAPSKPSAPQYPYSVYLGSFKAPEAVKKALSDYQEKGLSAYWVKVDLGEKGVWYRFFTGYFRTKDEAAKYISEKAIQGAEPGITKYANLIGTYTSEKEAEDHKKALVSAGFYPYVIKDAEGKSLVYSGAFDRKEYAEKERDNLASKGLVSAVVER